MLTARMRVGWQDEAEEVSAEAKHNMIAMTSFFYMYADFTGGHFL